MFRFAAPYCFYLLALVPLLIALYWLAMQRRKRRMARFGIPASVERLMPESSPARIRNKFILLLIAFAAIVIALVRPQYGTKLKEVERTGMEIMLTVDVSNSMLTQDLEPSRLERTKNAILRLLESMHEDRVGLVVFAGDAYVQLPITSDYVTARNFVTRLSSSIVSRQGTAIGAAIELASNSFSSDSEGSRIIILISDGENHEDDAEAAAEVAANAGIKIYTIGIGTPEGSPIQIGSDYLRDEEGGIVVSKLDEALLQRIAMTTGGAYIRANNRSLGLDEITEQINLTEKRDFVSQVFDQFSEQYQYFIGLALMLLTAEFIMLGRKNRLLARFNVFGRRENS